MKHCMYAVMDCALLMVLGAGIGCRGQVQQKNEPTVVSPAVVGGPAVAFAKIHGGSSWVYVKSAGTGSVRRLTSSNRVWETNPSLSEDANLVAYAVADGPEAKSEVWVSRLDGSHAYRVSGIDEDATMPVFAPDSRSVFYVKSRFTGHYSPIARPRRHEFDIAKVMVGADGPVVGAGPVELTEQHFFDLRSLSVSPDGERFLITTSGYPIGDLIEEFDVATPLRVKRIFQPHVPSEPSTGPSYGEAGYTQDGMGVVFSAATSGQGGPYDYNIYQMSDVTGGEIRALTRRTGMMQGMAVRKDGTVSFTSEGNSYKVNAQTGAVERE